MKAPSLDARALGDWLVRHGEKIVVAVASLCAIMLVWSGVEAVRSSSVKENRAPEALDRTAAQARAHIDRDAQPPDDLLPPRSPLADAIDPWRLPLVPWKTGSSPGLTIAAPPAVVLLDRPLFDELAKRSQPDVLPIEDLRAVAGLAVVRAAPPPPGRGEGVRPPAGPAGKPPKPDAGAGRRPLSGLDAAAGRAEQPVFPGGAAGPVERSKIVPYVIVTGLIPAAKQREEYESRFASCGFPRPDKDTPHWTDFEIDRGTIGADGKETWKKIDLTAAAKKLAADGGVAAAAVPGDFLLGSEQLAVAGPEQPVRAKPREFCWPLPARIDGTWELGDLHPWIVERLVEKFAEEARRREAPDVGPEPGGPVIGGPEQRLPRGPVPEEMRQRGPDYRLFRFVDTAVEPGQTYRYRVRLKVDNPNYSEQPETMRPCLTDPSLALEPYLTSPDSQPSSTVTVPEKTRILVDALRREEVKELRLKPGTLEVLVMAPSQATGSFAIRALMADVGALVDVDEKFNLKNQRDRARGETVVTNQLLLDARGRQEDRRDTVPEKGKPPAGIAEPLEVLCMRPDGSFECASLAESALPLEAYRQTLPPRGTKADFKEATSDTLLPGFDPLGGPRSGR